MKRLIALVSVIAVLVSAVFASVAGADPGNSQGKGNGQLGPGNGNCTAGSQASPGNSYGADFKSGGFHGGGRRC